jgi:CheY-like chemotaxis protein
LENLRNDALPQAVDAWPSATLRHEAVEVHSGPRSSPSAEDFLRARYAGLRVLVAEDDPVNAELACILLEDIGFSVDAAQDGQEALQCARTAPYQLILMDMQMPKMDGLEATRAIRKLPAHATTPIVACTGNALPQARAHCLEAGMNRFLTKPLLREKLYAAIFDVLENPGTA